MEEVFKGKIFGNILHTRDGRRAIFIDKCIPLNAMHKPYFRCWIEGDDEATEYNEFGYLYAVSYCEDEEGNIEVLGDDIVGD